MSIEVMRQESLAKIMSRNASHTTPRYDKNLTPFHVKAQKYLLILHLSVTTPVNHA
jgi:hypothetical protein